MNRRPNLTKRQSHVLEFLRSYATEHGISPTLEEIGAALGVNRVTVFEHVKALEQKGWIRSEKHLSRSIEIIDEVEEGAGIPMLGRIAAGQPIDVVPEAERDRIDPASLFDADKDLYMLQVSGQSMIEDNISDGDYVVVEARSTATTGETVVALVRGEEATLKRYYPMGPLTRLQPRNSEMDPIVVPSQDVTIQGVVVGVIRQY